MPAHIREMFDTAVQAHEDAHRTVETAVRELERAEKARDAVVIDEQNLEREDEIERLLGTLRSRYLTAEEDRADPDARSIATSGRSSGMAGYNVQVSDGTRPSRASKQGSQIPCAGQKIPG